MPQSAQTEALALPVLFSLLCIKRQKIITNAMDKLNTFEELLSKLEKIKHCLIYCSPEQIRNVQEILNEKGIIQHRFTHEEKTSQGI